MVIGHTTIQDRMRRSLPRVSLLLGPESVGKTTLAFETIRFHGTRDDDVLRFRKLTVGAAKTVSEAAAVAPKGKRRVFVLWIDGAADDALNVLLKALEESPGSSRFILIATEKPSETIASRATVFRFPLLSPANVEEILLSRGLNPTVAKNASMASKGQMSHALRYVNGATEAKMGVLAVVNAILSRDEDALSAHASKWSDDHTDVLTSLGYEVITKQWRVFDPAEVEGVTSKLALRVLEAIRPRVRGRLTINASLMAVLKEGY